MKVFLANDNHAVACILDVAQKVRPGNKQVLLDVPSICHGGLGWQHLIFEPLTWLACC